MNKGRAVSLLALLMLVSLAAQVVPFLVASARPLGAADSSGGQVPGDVPSGYAAENYFRAEAFRRPLAPALAAARATVVLGFLVAAVSGVASAIGAKLGSSKRRWLWVCLFFAGLHLGACLVGLPFRIASHFHHRAYGLTDMAFLDWLAFRAARFALPFVLFVAICVVVFCMIHLSRKRWWIICPLLIFAVFKLVPEAFSNRPMDVGKELRPLSEEPFREELGKVSRAAGVELDFVVDDHSKREKTVNVYLGGRAASRYVVLTDTFLREFTPREAAAALAHELGHRTHETTFFLAYKGLALLKLLAAFLLAFLLLRRRTATQPLQMVTVVVLCLALTDSAFLPVDRAISRAGERSADRYALQLTGDADRFVSLLTKGAKTNLERWETPWWEYYLFSGYPSLRARIEAARAYGGGAGRRQETTTEPDSSTRSALPPEAFGHAGEVLQELSAVEEGGLVRLRMELDPVERTRRVTHRFDAAVLAGRQEHEAFGQLLHFAVMRAPHGHRLGEPGEERVLLHPLDREEAVGNEVA